MMIMIIMIIIIIMMMMIMIIRGRLGKRRGGSHLNIPDVREEEEEEEKEEEEEEEEEGKRETKYVSRKTMKGEGKEACMI